MYASAVSWPDRGFSAIARSVMISAVSGTNVQNQTLCFSAIARSVMISASEKDRDASAAEVSVL